MPFTETINDLVRKMNELIAVVNDIRFRVEILEEEVLGEKRLRRREILFRRFRS